MPFTIIRIMNNNSKAVKKKMIKYGISLILFDNDWLITNNEEQIIRKNKKYNIV